MSDRRPLGTGRCPTSSRAAVGEMTAIAFAFTVQRGTWDVDDLFVDPYRSR
jgi:hypothetical protein